MTIKYHQISLKETYSECQDMFVNDTPTFSNFLILTCYLMNLSRRNSIMLFTKFLAESAFSGFLSALILQKIFSIPSDFLLILLLNICREPRNFCGFSKVPDAPLFTRFKQDFLPYLELKFQRMVDYTEPICRSIDSALADILTFDTLALNFMLLRTASKP